MQCRAFCGKSFFLIPLLRYIYVFSPLHLFATNKMFMEMAIRLRVPNLLVLRRLAFSSDTSFPLGFPLGGKEALDINADTVLFLVYHTGDDVDN